MSLEEQIVEAVKDALPGAVAKAHDLFGDAQLTPKEAAALLGIGKTTLQTLRIERVYVTPDAPRYRLSAIREFQRKNATI